jgi:signal transduction histidine kinase
MNSPEHADYPSTADLPLTAAPDVGDMEKRIGAFDWSRTPLGPIAQWPQSLRTTVSILLSSRYAMWMAWGPELTMIYNDAYRPTLGIKHPWSLGAPASEVWAEIWGDIGPRIDRVLTTGKATYDEGLRLFLERSGFPEETYHTFSYSPLTDDEGRISGMLCVVTEETERIIGERRVATLREVASALAPAKTEDEVLQQLTGQLNLNHRDLPFVLTYLFDKDGTARLASLSGISPGHPLAAERIAAGSDVPWPAHEIFRRQSPSVIETLCQAAKGIALPKGDWNKPVEHTVAIPIQQQGQERAAGFLIIGTNPYRRYDRAYRGFVDLLVGQIAAALGNARAHEAELRRAEALLELDRAKTTFFSNVSHELRTPLTLMLSPVEQLLAEIQDKTPRETELLRLIHRNGLRLQKLVNTLLDFSRIEAGRMQAVLEPVELGKFTEDLAANFRSAMERAGLEFIVQCETFFEPVYVDRDMWEKIVLNLISNALKFTFHGKVTVDLRAEGPNAKLTVSDTGTGIPEKDRLHIFERFHRVENARGRTIEGTGIGLALVQELVKLQGGSIEVASELDAGSTFVVYLPLRTVHLTKGKPSGLGPAGVAPRIFVDEALRWLPSPESAGTGGVVRSSASVAPQVGRQKILLADDNADMREYVAGLLHDHYDVAAVANGREALEATFASAPDLILSDVMMPEMNGFELVSALREDPRTKTLPVILLSARAGEESRVEGLTGGADDYLIKPFTARELLARVGAHLSMQKRREEAEAELQESQTTLQSFYDSSPLLMGVAEIEGDEIEPIYQNAAARNFFGPGAQAAASHEITGLWLQNYRKSQHEVGPVRFEYEHPRDAQSYWLSVTVNYLGIGRTGLTRFSFVAEDITEQKLAADRLLRSNEELRHANADLEQFAYSASHDLQEPLRQVAVYAQLLEARYSDKLEGKGLDYLAYCVKGAHRMEMLISDLLAYSQATNETPGPIQMVDTNEILSEVKRALITAIEETSAVVSGLNLPTLMGDPVPFTHLFQNLVSNAIKYRSQQSPRVILSATREGDGWRFSVQDNGIGIPQEFHQQIFGIFRRLHRKEEYPGTGIGLAICQKIVERYGGRIWVESEVGRGSTFFFTLPRIGSSR